MANAVGQDSEQQSAVEREIGVGRKGSEEGSVGVWEQEQGAGYVDIPRRIAWERLGSRRKAHALQVGPCMWAARLPTAAGGAHHSIICLAFTYKA